VTKKNLVLMLTIVVPALRDYRFGVLLYTQPITLYPGELWWHQKSVTIQIGDERSFRDAVKNILSSPETQAVIAGLLAQASQDV
jgi:hypothetical protein